MGYIVKNNLIDPEVFADFVEKKFVDKGVFSAWATSDNTLVGQAGSTLSFPVYSYIGNSALLTEGGQIAVDNITQTHADVTVKQVAKGTGIYDWALVNGLGNAMDEASSQVALSLSDFRDNDLKSAIDSNANVVRFNVGSDYSADTIIDAEALWGEDLNDKRFGLICSAKALASLRKDSDYINGSEMQTDMMVRGTVGSIWGANITPSNKCKANNEAYLIKEGAIRFVEKKGVNVELEREPDYKRTSIYADVMYAPYVYKPQDIIHLVKYSAVDTSVTFTCSAVASSKTTVDATNFKAICPVNCKIVYKTNESSEGSATWGTALTSYTELPANGEIAGTAGKYVNLAIVDADNKPLVFKSVLLA